MSQQAMPHQMVDRDEEHLRLLGNYHLLVAGLNALGLLFFVLLPLILGPAYINAIGGDIGNPPELLQRRLLATLIIGGILTFIYAMNGISLKNKRNRISIFMMSVLECLNFPLGMILGISTILVMRRESVKALFSAARLQPSTSS